MRNMLFNLAKWEIIIKHVIWTYEYWFSTSRSLSTVGDDAMIRSFIMHERAARNQTKLCCSRPGGRWNNDDVLLQNERSPGIRDSMFGWGGGRSIPIACDAWYFAGRRVGGGGVHVYMQNYVGLSGIPERREMERANSSESTCATHSGILFCFSTGSIFVCVCLCVFAIRLKGVCDITKQTEASQMPFDPPPLPHLWCELRALNINTIVFMFCLR